MSLLSWLKFSELGDERGNLVALEQDRTIPFEVKRVYYIYRTQPGVSRGFHAHKDLKQAAVCVAGKCRMVLDDGKQREETWLDNPARGLLIESGIWREMHDFSPDCVLLVLANRLYDESDYIRNYDEFLAMTEAMKRG
ncbi:FdtA/QdtA family cupin domain-containing protein [Pseudomonas sp. HR96]|uniref:sugar 3,4-ketoisomerase n=1 Tax=Pseudomonas sp. HR96 TaxID=1027966 RepID=UPI002A764816|nr:FdtA/QdtA family cupin domain-containing protein [Pseudomonas sp. HR96]WPO98871.1 FdtA/QdtA family cupin domain-containing protein [Pseudomonas sp. HR96]